MNVVAPPRPGLFYRARKRLRALVAPYPALYRLLLALWGAFFGLRFFLRALIAGRLRERRAPEETMAFLGRQTVPRLPTGLPECADAEALAAALPQAAVGGWTLYLPPEQALAVCPDLARRYPAGAGLKILKDPAPPESARYTPHELNAAPGAELLRRLTPPPATLLRIAQALHRAGLGPRVHDLVALATPSGERTAYVVEDAPEPAPADRHAPFLADLKAVLADSALATMHGRIEGTLDFEPPDCNGNLRLDRAGRPVYVDFQAFTFRDELAELAAIVDDGRASVHFGAGRGFRGGGAYLYQGIPGLEAGKRDVTRRWRDLETLLAEAGGSFQDRLVMDIGCNSGLMLYGGLARGACWGLGWDLPEVARVAGALLPALGATRSSVTGVAIGPETDFAADLPTHLREQRDGVLFYLSVSDHIGFPEGVAALPWRWMIYEGHADQGIGDQAERLRAVPWLADAEIRASRMLVDGDSPPRPVLVLSR